MEKALLSTIQMPHVLAVAVKVSQFEDKFSLNI
jgi:hypothetical protein